MRRPAPVVIPFAVPSESRGLGLGLAALVHAHVHVGGEGVALARLKAQGGSGGALDEDPAVEAFVGPDMWRGLTQGTDGLRAEGVVLTGQLDPPASGQGALRLLAFDAESGRPRAEVDEPLDEPGAGASIVRALDALWTELGGEIGALRTVGDLAWEPLESVLRAEQSSLVDPAVGRPRDGLAALVHLGRAISDAPDAQYPAQRLAMIALESFSDASVRPGLAAATKRALLRALDDAPTHVELAEALAGFELRMGRPRQAELHLQAAIELSPKRPALYLLLAHALRAQRDIRGALASIDIGLGLDRDNTMLRAGRGELLAESGDLAGAVTMWRDVLAQDPVQPAAFAGMAFASLRTGDALSAQALVDAALEARRPSPDVLRCAIDLALGTEPEGIARAARVARLCQRALEPGRSDGWALLLLAHAMRALGDEVATRATLDELDVRAPGSAPSAESVLMRIALEDPVVEAEIVCVMRAVHRASPVDLHALASRARRFATMRGVWVGDVAAAVAERRQGRWHAARDLLDHALTIAPGAAAAHAEMSLVQWTLHEDASAGSHRRTARDLQTQTPRSLATLPTRIWTDGRRVEHRVEPDMMPEPASWNERLRRLWDRVRD
jgi:tetratricopeptide (TPR) repeat protein